MGKIGHWIVSLIGYGLYTLAAVVLFLWFLFPTDSFRLWLERQLTSLNPTLNWEVQEVRLAWPLSLVAVKIEAKENQGAEKLFAVDSLKIRPDLGGLTGFQDTVPLVYSMKTLNGSVEGKIMFGKENGVVKSSGDIDRVQLKGLGKIWQKLGRQVSADMSGTYSCEGKWKNLMAGDLQAKLKLVEGDFGLRQPIMGLESMRFREMDTSLSLKDRVMTIDEGKIESDLFAAEFTGTVTLAEDIIASDLDVKGWFEPRPELLSTLKDQKIVRLIKSQLRNDKLNFTLTDTLMMPGILFEGASGVIDGLIQGGGR